MTFGVGLLIFVVGVLVGAIGAGIALRKNRRWRGPLLGD